MKKRLFLSLRVQSTSTKKPIYEVLVGERNLCDDRVITIIDDANEKHDFDVALNEINHIEIRFLNKDPGDTKVDQNGRITEDMLLVIDNIKIDHVDLTTKLSKISVYKDSQGQICRTSNYITFKGIFKIKIHRNLLYTEWLASYL
jgi:hypothetical protein